MLEYPFIMQKTKFSVNKRDQQKPTQLRRQGLVPANVYQSGQDSVAVQMSAVDFLRLEKNIGENAIIYLQVEGEAQDRPVLIDEVQYDVLGKQILHVVFRGVNLKEKITAFISLETSGEFKVPDGVLVLVKDSVEVEALPTDLPESFVLDLGKLQNIGDQITLADLEINHDKIHLLLGEDEQPGEVVLALAQEKAEEVEEEAVSTEVVEPELVGDKQKEEPTAEEPASWV